MKRWMAWTLLALLSGTVLAVNAEHFGRNPFPPRSMHRAFMMVPRLVRVFQGYRQRPGVVDHLDPSGKSYALPYRTPIPWTDPVGLWQELRQGGRLHRLFGGCTAGFYTCMPHAFALPALIGTAFPGHPVWVDLGVTLYFLLLIVSAYGIAAEAAGRGAGLTAAALAASYPGLFGYSRWVEGYLPATALSVAMVFLLIRSKGLTRWGPCILFFLLAFSAIHNGEGLSEGIGAGLAVAGPFFVTFVHGVAQAVRERRWPWRTAVGAAVIVGLLLATMDWPWLLRGLEHVFTGFDEWYVDARPPFPNAGPFMRAVFSKGAYFILVYSEYLKPLLTFWLLLAIPPFLLRRFRLKVTVIAWAIVPAVAYAVMSRKAMWYALPMVPPLAVITALGLAAIPWKQVRVTAMILAAGSGLFQFLSLSLPPVSALWTVPHYLRQPLPPNYLTIRLSELISPVKPNLMTLHDRTQRFLDHLDHALPRDDRLKYVAVASNWGEDIYEAQAFAYVVSLSRTDVEVIPLAEPAFVEMAPFSGLVPEYFTHYVKITGDGDFAPPRSKWGRAVVTNPGRPAHAPPALQRFADTLVRRSAGTAPDLPNVLVLSQDVLERARAATRDRATPQPH